MIARYYRKAWLYGGSTRQQYSPDSGMGKVFVCVSACVCVCMRGTGIVGYVVSYWLLWGEGSMCAWRESASVIMHALTCLASPLCICVCLHWVCLRVHAWFCCKLAFGIRQGAGGGQDQHQSERAKMSKNHVLKWGRIVSNLTWEMFMMEGFWLQLWMNTGVDLE